MRTFNILRMRHSGVEVDDDCVIVSLRVMGEGYKWLTLVDETARLNFILRKKIFLPCVKREK